MDDLKISFVDGYCGGGRYTNGAENFPGSPLIFLETVAQMEARIALARNNNFKINANYIFIDCNKRHTDYLRFEIENSDYRYLLDREITIWTGDFNELVDDAIKIVQAHTPRAGSSLFLLDQFGWSQVTLASIRKILRLLKKTEVFLTFTVDALINYITDKKFDLSAFGRIDLPPEFVQELIRYKEDEELGARSLLQKFIYEHIRAKTGSPYYSPFMIKSPKARRAHWFLHLSKHPEARNEIGEIHWSETNTTTDHGRPGFHALGFKPTADFEQHIFDSVLDEPARERSRRALREQVPRLLYDAIQDGRKPSIMELFGSRCSDTPIVRSLFDPEIINLRNERDIIIRDEKGVEKPRTLNLEWTDRVEASGAPKLFSPFQKIKRAT